MVLDNIKKITYVILKDGKIVDKFDGERYIEWVEKYKPEDASFYLDGADFYWKNEPENAINMYRYMIKNVSDYWEDVTYDHAIWIIDTILKFSDDKEDRLFFTSKFFDDTPPEYRLKIIEEYSNNKDQLTDKNKELEKQICEKENLQNRMQKLVEQFTHTLGNVIFPDTIYQVAERLKSNPDCRKDVLLLHDAYHSEIIIKLQGELLRQRYTNTNPEKFRQFIRSCRESSSDVSNSRSIDYILNYAASRVTARFLNQHYSALNSIRDKIILNKNKSLDALRQKFEDDILLNEVSSSIDWIGENLRPMQLTEISPLWKKVFIRSGSHAEALLFGYFSEILFNAFKYADHDKDEFLTLCFNESVVNDKTYLSCSWTNPIKDTTMYTSNLGTGKGLEAIQEDLKQLNDTESTEESLFVSKENNQFKVTLLFAKDLLVNELPTLKRQRKNVTE
jgi:hypothetical protein